MVRAPPRRTASFHNIEKIEEANKEEEEEEDTKPANHQQISSNSSGGHGTKYRNGAVKEFKQKQLKLQPNKKSAIDAKAYFAVGSVRNTAYDEEFFRVFGQYLDEAIVKLK